MIPKECTPDDPDWELWDRGSRVTDLLFKSGDSNDNLVQRIDHVAAGWVGLITEGTWRKFVPCTDEWDGARHVLRSIRGSEGVIEYHDFDKFLQQPPPQGLGDDERRSKFKAMVARFPADAQERINLALVAAEIKPIAEVRSEAVQKRWNKEKGIQSDPDNFVSEPVKSQRGTSKAYQLETLARHGQEETQAMVRNGEISVRDGLKRDGLLKARPRLELTPGTSPTKLALWLREHYGRDALKSLCQAIE